MAWSPPKVIDPSPGETMDFVIGIILIVFVAPLVGVVGKSIQKTGDSSRRRIIGRGFTIGYLAVIGIALWLIVRSF
jgi:hypothetical protein